MGDEDLIFASYPVFRASHRRSERFSEDVAVKEVEELLVEHNDRVKTRGVYSTVGLRANADLMFWWVSHSIQHLQGLTGAFRRTELGRSLDQVDIFVGLVRPAEFSKEHQPAFVQGHMPKPYLCVYPFVRTPEWYLLDPDEREWLLRQHGEAGREYPDVLANTTSAFGLGDYEWILAFEADGPERLVELIRRLRATRARRYTKIEAPFFTGIRTDLTGAVAAIPW